MKKFLIVLVALIGLGIGINIKSQNPEGIVVCNDCKGSGSVIKEEQCWLCKGKGTVPKTETEKCSDRDCKDGIVTIGNFSDKCLKCDGGKNLKKTTTNVPCTVSDCNKGTRKVKTDCKCKQYKK